MGKIIDKNNFDSSYPDGMSWNLVRKTCERSNRYRKRTVGFGVIVYYHPSDIQKHFQHRIDNSQGMSVKDSHVKKWQYMVDRSIEIANK